MKNIIQPLKTIILALIIGSGITYAIAWTGPTQTPPDGNVSAPINVGSISQTKSGDLGIRGILKAYQGVEFSDGTKQTSAQIEAITKTQAILIKDTRWIRADDGQQGEFIKWYDICPADYYLSRCALSASSLNGTDWAADQWDFLGGPVNYYNTLSQAVWSFWIAHSSEQIGFPSKFWNSRKGQIYKGDGTHGACAMRYNMPQSGRAPTGYDYTLKSQCIKIK